MPARKHNKAAAVAPKVKAAPVAETPVVATVPTEHPNVKILRRPTSHLHRLVSAYVKETTGTDLPADTIRQALAMNAQFRRSEGYAAFRAAGGSAAFREETAKNAKLEKLRAQIAALESGETPAAVSKPKAVVAPVEDVEPEEEADDEDWAEDEDESDDDEDSDEDEGDDTEDDEF